MHLNRHHAPESIMYQLPQYDYHNNDIYEFFVYRHLSVKPEFHGTRRI